MTREHHRDSLSDDEDIDASVIVPKKFDLSAPDLDVEQYTMCAWLIIFTNISQTRQYFCCILNLANCCFFSSSHSINQCIIFSRVTIVQVVLPYIRSGRCAGSYGLPSARVRQERTQAQTNRQ
jgi:hypothetical protein